MSTYNGEKYIREQIDSVLSQSYSNLELWVRDDGSADATPDILREYEAAGRITLLEGPNLKWGRSFLTLLEAAGQGDYWAFCDQDDVWMPEKIARAVQWMEKKDKDMPLLYCSSYEEVSEDLRDCMRTVVRPDVDCTFRLALTNCFYMGFATVINRPLRELMLKGDIDRLSSHDHWASLLVTKFGKAYWDPVVTAKHRRLESSASGQGFGNRLRWFIRTVKCGDSDIRSIAVQYCQVFSEQPDSDYRMAGWFAYSRYSLANAVRKALYPRRWRGSFSSDAAIRVLMITGRV